MATGGRVFRDPIYGYISVEDSLVKIVDHPMFQRLRRISQTSLTSYVYPSATGSRFEHALGSMHLAGRAWAAIWGTGTRTKMARADRTAFIRAVRQDFVGMPKDEDLFGEIMGIAFRAAALLHDVGHPPFSHALEEVYRWKLWDHDAEGGGGQEAALLEGTVKFHEYCGRLIAKRICDASFADPDDDLVKQEVDKVILQIINAGPSQWARALHGMISGHIDVDRIDYLIRDSHKAAGSEFGSIDYVRLLDALELRHEDDVDGEEGFAITPWVRARSAVETLLIQRLQAYEYIHFHPRVVGYNLALERATELFLELSEIENRGPSIAEIRYLLRGIRPNLVYWDPDLIDAPAALGLWRRPGTKEEPAQTSIEGVNAAEEFVANLEGDQERRRIAAAEVDDFTVLETLKRASLLAGSAPERFAPKPAPHADPNLHRDLGRLQIYIDAAVFRRKNFVPAWKGAEEYMQAAADMEDALLSVVLARLGEKAEDLGGISANTLNVFADRIEKTRPESPLGELRPDPRVNSVIALNTLADLLLFSRQMREWIREKLNEKPTIGGNPGVWDLRYVGGPPEKLDLTMRSSRGEEAIIEGSPLAEAVWIAEERKAKLSIFFYFERLDFTESGPAGKLRSEVRKEAIARLPKIILEAIDNYV